MAGLTEEEELELLELEEAEALEAEATPEVKEPIPFPDLMGSAMDVEALKSGEPTPGIEVDPAQREAFYGSAIQSGTLGLSDRLKAAIGDQSYEDIYSERQAKEKEFPLATGLGTAAGTAATLAIPGATAGGIIKPALAATAMGATEGAATATPDESILAEGAKGAGLGAGAVLGLGAAGKLASKLAGRSGTRDIAEKTAKSALGLDKGALRTKLRKMDPSGETALETTRFAKDQGILRSGSSSKEMLDRTLDTREAIGKELGDIIDSGTPIDIKSTVSKLRSSAEDSAAGLDDVTAKHIHDYADKLENMSSTNPNLGSRLMGPKMSKSTVTPEELRNLKTKLGAKVKDFTKDSDIIDARKASYGVLSDTIEESLAPAQRAKLKELNERYTKTKHLEEGLTGKVDADESADMFGWQNMMLGTHNLAAPVARELMRSYGKSFAALGVRKPNVVLKNSKWAELFKAATDKSGAAGIASAHYQLMQTDEDYRKAHSKKKD